MLVQYLRNKKGQKTGVMVSTTINNKVFVGVSKCNMKKDKFNPELGKALAELDLYREALTGYSTVTLNDFEYIQYARFFRRSQRYYRCI